MALASAERPFNLLQDTANLSKPVQAGTNKNGDDVWIVCGGRAAIDSLREEAAAEHADNEKSGKVKIFYVGNRDKAPLPCWVIHLKRGDGESFTDHPGKPSVDSIQQHTLYLEEIAAQITSQRGDNVRLVVVLCDQGLNRGPSAAAYALAKWINIAGKDAAVAMQCASNARTVLTSSRSRSALPVVKPCCIMIGENNWLAACNAYVPPASSVAGVTEDDESDDEYPPA